jgi:hypothetical protein
MRIEHKILYTQYIKCSNCSPSCCPHVIIRRLKLERMRRSFAELMNSESNLWEAVNKINNDKKWLYIEKYVHT